MEATTTYRDSSVTTRQSADERARSLAVIERICGPLDAATRRAGAVLEAHGAALAWARDTTGRYPSPKSVTTAIREAADGLHDVADERDPKQVLLAVAAEALGAHMATPS